MSKGNFDGGGPSILRPAAPRTESARVTQRRRDRAAARAVACRAVTADDCATLLDMLGLNAAQGKAVL
jgi:hypothetical protein